MGVIAVVLFQGEFYLPVWTSVAIFSVISLYLLRQFSCKRIGILILLLWLVYAVPFIHIVPYLWFDFSRDESLTFWSLAVNPYLLDEKIVRLTAMIGAIGGLGFGLGVSLNQKKIVRDQSLPYVESTQRVSALSTPLWIFWVIAGVALSWLTAPQETLFTAVYTESKSLLENANFSSSWLVSYVLLTYALCDAIVDRCTARKVLKIKIIFFTITFVVIYLQLLRGDRESMPFVLGALLTYYYWAAPLVTTKKISLSWSQITPVALFLFVAAMLIGAVRNSLTDIKDIAGFIAVLGDAVNSKETGVANFLHGTWSAVLLTPLSVAGDYVNGLLSFKFGEDYVNLLLSVPPGFIADLVGYSRPLDSGIGPAWEMRYGIGGTHLSVVPFMNFGMTGVFLVLAFWSYFFARYEKIALGKINIKNLSLLCTVVAVVPHWFWYGDKIGLNALIIWLILGVGYRVFVRIGGKSDIVRTNMSTCDHG